MKRILRIPNIIISFFKDVIQEIKITEFPSGRSTLKMTNTVLLISIALTLVLLSLDYIFILFRNYLANI